MDHICKRISRIREYIDKNNYKAEIMAVTKSVGVPEILESHRCGITLFGENRWQVARGKLEELNEQGINLDFYFIGHLQKNKVKYVIKHFKGIYSVDSSELAFKIGEEMKKRMPNDIIDVLIEVNVSGEDSKYGVNPSKTIELYESIKDIKEINVRGVMAMGPLTDDENRIRESFKLARNVFEEIKKYADEKWIVLSIGMSDDFHIALEEGANLLRIGRGIFSKDVSLPI